MSRHSQSPGNILPATLPLLEAFLQSNTDRGLSPKTIKWYRDFLKHFAATFPVMPSDAGAIEGWVSSYHSSDERRHGAYRACRAFYYFCARRYDCEQLENVIRKVAAPKRTRKEKRPLSDQELKQLLEFPGYDSQIRALLYTLADTGCRIGEAVSLTQERVGSDTLTVCGKTGERVIPVSPKVRDMLRQLGPGKLFQCTTDWYIRLISEAFKAAGVRGSAHLLRHTFASNWTGSTEGLKNIGGWMSWTMVSTYSHKNIKQLVAEHAKNALLTSLNEGKDIPPTLAGSSKDREVRERHLTPSPKIGTGKLRHKDRKCFFSGMLCCTMSPAKWLNSLLNMPKRRLRMIYVTVTSPLNCWVMLKHRMRRTGKS